MKVYLAAAFSRKDEIKAIALKLQSLGIVVTSRWLDEPTFNPSVQDEKLFFAGCAQRDLDDIDRADILVRFSDDLTPKMVPSHLATGSRMGETCWASAHGKKVIVVGGHQCVFDWLPQIMHLKNVDELCEFLYEERAVENIHNRVTS